MDVEHIVELEWLAVLHERLEHRHLDALGSHLVVRVADMAQERHPRLLEVREVSAVVDDAHRVGLGEPDTDALGERIAGGVEGGLNGRAHFLGPYSALMTPAIRALEAAGVEFRVLEYERGESRRDFGRAAAEALGLDHDQVFKTLIVTADGSEAVAIVPVTCTVGLKAVGTALGAKRVEMCDPERAQRLTGYVLGGISPFGQKKKLPTVVDETSGLFETIYVSGGKRGVDVEVRTADLIILTDAMIADIAVSD